MSVRITTLSENTANYGYLGEWGLSILVETEDETVLLDTGLGDTILHNVERAKADLSKVDRIVISHGHIDHTGGLVNVLAAGGGTEIIANPDLWVPKFSRNNSGKLNEIGIPFGRAELEDLGARFTISREPVRIGRNILTTGEVPMTNDFEEIESNLFIKKNDEFIPDPMPDDQGLIVDTEFGLVVILGCAHRGIINTLHHACNLTGKDSVYAVIGGTHLHQASEDRVEKTAAELKQLGVVRLGVSHCTGFKASARLAAKFQDCFFLNNSGTVIELP